MAYDFFSTGDWFIQAMRKNLIRLSILERRRLHCPYDFTLPGKIDQLERELGKQVLVTEEFLVDMQLASLLQEVRLNAESLQRYRAAALDLE